MVSNHAEESIYYPYFQEIFICSENQIVSRNMFFKLPRVANKFQKMRVFLITHLLCRCTKIFFVTWIRNRSSTSLTSFLTFQSQQFSNYAKTYVFRSMPRQESRCHNEKIISDSESAWKIRSEKNLTKNFGEKLKKRNFLFLLIFFYYFFIYYC